MGKIGTELNNHDAAVVLAEHALLVQGCQIVSQAALKAG